MDCFEDSKILNVNNKETVSKLFHAAELPLMGETLKIGPV